MLHVPLQEIVRQASPLNARLFGNFMSLARNPDPRSEFAQKTEVARHDLTDAQYAEWLLGQHYRSVLFLEQDETFVGQVTFQEHEGIPHVFSVWVSAALRKKGLGTLMVREFLIDVYDEGIRRVQIGNGGHEAVSRICGHAVDGDLDLPFRVTAGQGPGWLELSPIH